MVAGKVIFVKVLLGDHYRVCRSEPGLVAIKSQESMKCQCFIDRAHTLSDTMMGAVYSGKDCFGPCECGFVTLAMLVNQTITTL